MRGVRNHVCNKRKVNGRAHETADGMRTFGPGDARSKFSNATAVPIKQNSFDVTVSPYFFRQLRYLFAGNLQFELVKLSRIESSELKRDSVLRCLPETTMTA